MKVLGIIPARYASTRFPGKPLANIHGKTMIRRVFDQASKSKLLTDIVVATDDNRILDHVINFGGKAIMTSEKHQSGTERCGEAAEKLDEEFDIIINIQGDEPFIHPEQIDKVAACFLYPEADIATLAIKIKSEEELFNPNIVKVIINNKKDAIYFSRAAIPYNRGQEKESWLGNYNYYKHIGIYGYRKDILTQITKLEKSDLERAESLEQLRWIENGYSITVEFTELESYGIDTAEDLEKLINNT